MASGSFDLTTYYAKRIIGDTNAASAATALLQAGVDDSMWIFGHNRNNYGIRYLYDSSTNGTADKIEFHGGHATNTTAWIQLDTGDASFGIIKNGTWQASVIAPAYGGTGVDSYAKGDILYAGAAIANTDTTALSKLALGTAGYTLQATANGPAWTQTVAVANGGTGKTSWTKGGIIYASATDTLTQIADGSADKVLRSTASATYSWLSYTSSSTASTIVYRDASKNFSAGTITASLSGNATSATKANITSNKYGISYYSDTAGTFATTAQGTSGYLLQAGGSSAAPSWIQATNANTASTIVKRDSSGNFSAGTITATLSGNATSANAIKSLGRQTSTDITHIQNGGLQFFLVDGNTTTNKPASDGFILHAHWDGAASNAWDAQLYIPDGHSGHMQFRGHSNATTWGTSWITLLDSGNYTTYTVKKDGTGASGTWSINVTGAARYLENRGGTNVTITDDTWNHGYVPNDHTNRATVWHQRWKQSGITYTPSGGSATTLTDSADMVLWLSSSNTANTLQLNMTIDGDFYTMGSVRTGKNIYCIGSGDRYVKAENTATGVKIYLDTGSGANHGIYSDGYNTGTTTSTFQSSGLFMIYRNSSNQVVINRTHAVVEQQSVSYIAGAKGDTAGLLAKKTEGASAWYPAVCIQTKAAGSWQIGTYTSESLEFVYAAKADITNQTNDNAKHWYLTADSYGTILTTRNYSSYALPLSGGTMTGDLKGSKTNIIGSTAIANHWYKLYLGGQTVGSNEINSATPLIEFSNVDRSQYCQLIYSDYDSVVAPDSLTLIGNQAGTHFIAPKINAGDYINNSYAMSTASFICNDWVRTNGNTGWYNQDYGGGWYMNDTTWIRSYGSKPVVIDINSGNTYGQNGHRMGLALLGNGHVSLMLMAKDQNVGYSLCANGNGNWYFGKRTTNNLTSTTGDTYLYYGNTTHFSPGTNDTLSLGLDGARWSALYSKVMYFGEASMNRAILAYSSGANKYGIWYNEGTPDTMRFSASGNADTNAGADLCINGNGDGTVTIRGNTILHMGNAWYAKTCSITSNNMSNYPWHRFAYCTTGTAQYQDRTAIIILNSRYRGGPYGIIKLEVRMNATGGNIDTSAKWIIRYGFSAGDVKISTTSNKVGTDTTISAYVKCPTYARRIAYMASGSNNGWTLVSSNEPADTTSSDKKGGTEINASVSGAEATDCGIVSGSYYLASGVTTNDIGTYCNVKVYSERGNYWGLFIGNTAAKGFCLMGHKDGDYMGLYKETAPGSAWILCYRPSLSKVGIMTSSPTATLSVAGTMSATGTVSIINNTQNDATYNALLYIEHKSGNDWGILVNKNDTYDYGIRVQCLSTGSNGINCTGRITGTKVYGAVWNDYAEYRQGEITEGGYCVHECPDGTMRKSTERLEAGCRVTSDTFGFAIGETEKNKTPIAVSGRVLVYPYRDKKEYKLGDAVCSAPDGKVDIMSRNEIIIYPERIIGTVSEIPDYDIWECGEGKDDKLNHRPVNGRIWIYVR